MVVVVVSLLLEELAKQEEEEASCGAAFVNDGRTKQCKGVQTEQREVKLSRTDANFMAQHFVSGVGITTECYY